MAWTKAKAVIVASAALLLATGTTVVVVEKILPTTVDESFWAMKVENLDKAPPVLIIRPPRYKDRGMMSQSSDNNSKIYRKVIAHNMDIKGLVWCAYSPSPQRMIMPADAPTKLFDLMLTLRSHSNEALQKAIKEKFGITAKRETRETDVLVLQIKDSGLLAGHVSQGRGRVGFKYENGLAAWSNAPISKIADFLEHTFDKPVIVQSDLTGKYDITFQWEQGQNERRALSDELAQAGLELVPDREPIEMLVVEKH